METQTLIPTRIRTMVVYVAIPITLFTVVAILVAGVFPMMTAPQAPPAPEIVAGVDTSVLFGRKYVDHITMTPQQIVSVAKLQEITTVAPLISANLPLPEAQSEFETHRNALLSAVFNMADGQEKRSAVWNEIWWMRQAATENPTIQYGMEDALLSLYSSGIQNPTIAASDWLANVRLPLAYAASQVDSLPTVYLSYPQPDGTAMTLSAQQLLEKYDLQLAQAFQQELQVKAQIQLELASLDPAGIPSEQPPSSPPQSPAAVVMDFVTELPGQSEVPPLVTALVAEGNSWSIGGSIAEFMFAGRIFYDWAILWKDPAILGPSADTEWFVCDITNQPERNFKVLGQSFYIYSVVSCSYDPQQVSPDLAHPSTTEAHELDTGVKWGKNVAGYWFNASLASIYDPAQMLQVGSDYSQLTLSNLLLTGMRWIGDLSDIFPDAGP